jgi:hypothetical protein
MELARCTAVRRPKGSDGRNRGRFGRVVRHLWRLSNHGIGGDARFLASHDASARFCDALPRLEWPERSLCRVGTASINAGKVALRRVLLFRLGEAGTGREHCGSLSIRAVHDVSNLILGMRGG